MKKKRDRLKLGDGLGLGGWVVARSQKESGESGRKTRNEKTERQKLKIFPFLHLSLVVCVFLV